MRGAFHPLPMSDKGATTVRVQRLGNKPECKLL